MPSNQLRDARSFAQQMLHLTDANFGFAAAATGEKSPVGFGKWKKQQMYPKPMYPNWLWMVMIYDQCH